MKQIQPVFLAMKFSFLIFFFFSLPVGAQSIFQKYERFLTEPRSYVCYRTDGKLKIDGKLDEASCKTDSSVCRYQRGGVSYT